MSVDLWEGTSAAPSPDSPDYAAWIAQRIASRSAEEYITLRARERASERRNRELAEQAKRDAANSARVKDGATFLLDIPPTPPAIWGEGDDILWARGEALIVWGPNGVGKTTLAGQILAGVLGILPKVLGLPVVPCEKRALYLAMDRPQQAQRSLSRLFGEQHRELLADKLRFWTGPPPADFATTPETMLEMCRRHDADTVFVDSLKDAAVGLAKDEVGAGYNRCRQLTLAEGVNVVELHHPRKTGENGGKADGLNDMYGSTWIPSGCGSAILLWGDAGDALVEFLHRKQPMNTVGPFHIEHDSRTGLSAVHYDDRKDLVELARRCGTTGLTAKDAAVALKGDEGTPANKDVAAARRKLQDLEKKGLLVSRKPSTAGRGQAETWLAAARPEDIQREMGVASAGGCSVCGQDPMSQEHEVLCLYRGVPVNQAASVLPLSAEEITAMRVAHEGLS